MSSEACNFVGTSKQYAKQRLNSTRKDERKKKHIWKGMAPVIDIKGLNVNGINSDKSFRPKVKRETVLEPGGVRPSWVSPSIMVNQHQFPHMPIGSEC